jgi:hypothetical protein
VITQLEDQAEVTLSFHDYPALAGYGGKWNIMQGGNVSAASTKGELPAREGTISFGGKRAVQNITLRRYYFPDRDEPFTVPLGLACGEAPCTITRRSIDRHGNPLRITPGLKWEGTLMDVAIPDVDSDSQNKAYIQLIIETEGDIAWAPPS